MDPNERHVHGNNYPSQLKTSDLVGQNHANTIDPNGTNPIYQNGSAESEESPELLRWRADTLLDEMMLGGVDISAGGSSSIEQRAESSSNRTQNTQAYSPPPPRNGATPGEYDQPPSYSPQQPTKPTQLPAEQLRTEHVSTEGAQPTDLWAQNQYTLPQPNMPAGYTHADVHPGNVQEETPRQPPAPGVQQPYLQQTHPQNYTNPPGMPSGQNALPNDSSYSQSAPNPSPTSQPEYGQPQYSPPPYNPPPKERPAWNVVSGHANEYLDSVPRHETVRTNYSGYYPDGNLGSNNSGGYGPSSAHPNSEHPSYIPQLGPVVQGQASSPFADPMEVGGRRARTPNLLPRQSQLDMQALKQEMATLQEKVDTALPIGRDLTERAIHLLEKGSNILDNFPNRSAEVSYYVQQVRSILQRAEQRVFWSNIYRKRLSLYLVAWFLLSIVLILSCVLYPQLLASSAASLMGMATSGWVGQHITAFVLTIGASALGSSLGTLINMFRYGQSDHGFFDRKYGLLGLILPIIGVIVGTLGYLVFGIIALILGINPASFFLIALIPATFAFLFGFGQERIYGTVN